ncbi:Tyrosine-protein phosphatase non-receptor type 23 [Bagarius yarrelli]|uniref:Tyrosine-protein phosphatase non-receptor type 23 n=1 Tax=Bagarius yarrelli TaxID=175774 RepID=A0A556TLM5_BAGYA|nr:Tyrosine-protein phosphatase non-receptor type 23 [Bagarius yarrelli]
MEAVPRMPMIWLDLKEAGEFQFSSTVKQARFILKNYGEDPDNYNESLKKLEQLRQVSRRCTPAYQLSLSTSCLTSGFPPQSAVNVTRDFEGCSTLRKYFGQLHYLQSRVPLGPGQEAAVPVSWTEIFSGKTVTHDDISYEQACILYNLGDEGECLLEKSMLDNRKSFLVARISAQVVEYYKEACRALENSDTASMLGKIQKDWKKLVQMKIYYFAAVAHLHMGKQAEEQQKYGERLAYLQSSLDKLNEAIKLAKGQPDSVQEALRFTMDVIGGKFNSAKKDNDFIYHETVPCLETLPSVKGAPLVKALPVNPTDPSVTGPDIFSKLVPMAAHEASSLYSEEKAKLLRDVMTKIDSKNETLEQFMDSLNLDPDSVDNMDRYNSIPSVLMEKCAALSVRPDTVKSLIQSMQVLSGVFTDVEASLREIRLVLDDDEASDRKLEEVAGKQCVPAQPATIAEIRRDLEKYVEAHEKASFTNTELHRAMNLHISNLRLLGGPLDTLREALPRPQLSEDEVAGLQCMKRILGKVQEMKDQRNSLEKQLRELIQQDDITAALVTTERADMKRLFEEQLKKYEQVKVYIDQNLAAQENILKALTDANVQYATVRKGLAETEHKWNSTVQMLVASYEAYEDLMKKSQEGKEFYEDLEAKSSRLLERAKSICKTRDEERQAILEKELQKKVPQRPTAPKPAQKKAPDMDLSGIEDPELAKINAAILALGGDLPEDLRSLPPELGRPSIPEAFHPGAAALYARPLFPPNLPPPELLAQISRFTLPPTQGFNRNPTTGPLPHQHQVPQLPNPQIAQLPSVPGYGLPSSQTQPAASGPPTAIGMSTTTVDSVHTPIPSYTSAPGHPVISTTPGHPIATSVGYNAPSAVASQYFQQPGVPVSQPPQGVQVPQPKPPPSQSFPQVRRQGQPQPSPPQTFYQAVPAQQHIAAPVTGPQLPQQTQPYALHHMAQPRPPNIQQQANNIHSTPSALSHQVYPAVSFVPGCQPAPNQLPYHSMQPQMPPNSQPMPQVSMSHLPNVKQIPPCSQPYMPPLNQQLHTIPQTPLSTQQAVPASHRQMPPTPQPQMLPSSAQISPPTHLQMPAVSQPGLQASHSPVSVSQSLPRSSHPPLHSVSQPLPHPSQVHPSYQQVFPGTTPRVPVPVQPQLPPASLPAQFPVHTNAPPSQPHSLPSQLPHGSLSSVPSQISLPQHHLPPQSTPMGYPGGIPLVPHQSTVPQQPQALPPQVPSGAQASYSGPHAGIHPGPIQNSGPVITPGIQSLPQGMIPPSSAAPGATPSNVLATPSASPSPGPSSLGIAPQRPSPALTPVPGAALPQTVVTPLPSSTHLFQHQNSSTDDLLSSSPESQHGSSKDTANVLLPMKADPQDEQLRKKSEGLKIIQGDPYQAPERVSQLCAELERFRSTVQSLERPSGEGSLSELDARWKELQDQQEKDSRQLSIAIARCYTMKNRHQDVMPYDCNRVVLDSGKDDYINASFIEELSPYCPRLIATQAPLTGTAADFWLMVYEQKVSLIVMLVSEQELEKQKVLRYFPSERGQQITQGSITLSLTTQKNTATHVERMIGLQYRDQSLKRTVIHLQFTSWPELGLPESKSNLIRFIQEVHGHYLLQRPLHTPVVVHCSSGVGRTGAFSLLYAALQELEAGNGIPDLPQLVRKMRQQRKNMLQEKLHLKFCYEAVLKHAEQVLQRRGIVTASSQKSTNSAAVKQYSQPEAQDIVLGGDMPISSIQATVARLSIRPPSVESDQDPNQDPVACVAAGLEPELALVQDLQAFSPSDTIPASLSPPISCPTSPVKMLSPSPPNYQGNGFEGSTIMPVSNNHAALEATLPAPSSLDLLASLTPEAFTLDSGCRGKQRISKQSFFQAQEGQGLQGPSNQDDPLSTLDPLWTLNKS